MLKLLRDQGMSREQLHTVFLALTVSRFYRAACNATHGIAVAIMSVRLSVCLSDACIVTKLNDGLRIF